MKGKVKIEFIIVICLWIIFVAAVAYAIYVKISTQKKMVSYIQTKEEVYNMECGIIFNSKTFRTSENAIITYDFDDPEYQELREKYELINLAGNGSEFDKAVNLMDHFSNKMKHDGNFADYTKDMNALYLLDFALGETKHGIHCRAKAQIMNEEYLALGIYSRKMWINPFSVYDGECHVVNEIWDSNYKKWIMLDTTNDIYWIGEEKVPLSALEVRQKFADQEFVTPVMPGESTEDLDALREKHMDLILYTAKNMAYFQYFLNYGVGEDDIIYSLLPETMEPVDSCLISEDTVKAPPVAE